MMNLRDYSRQRSGVTGRSASVTRPIGSLSSRYYYQQGQDAAASSAPVSLAGGLNESVYASTGSLLDMDINPYDNSGGDAHKGDNYGVPGSDEVGAQTAFGRGAMPEIAKEVPGMRTVQTAGELVDSLRTGEERGKRLGDFLKSTIRDIGLGPIGIIRGAALNAPVKAMAVDREVERLTGKTREEANWDAYRAARKSLDQQQKEDKTITNPNHPDITNREFAKMQYALEEGKKVTLFGNLRDFAMEKLGNLFGFEDEKVIDGPNRKGFDESSFANISNEDGNEPNEQTNGPNADGYQGAGNATGNYGDYGGNSESAGRDNYGGTGGNMGSTANATSTTNATSTANSGNTGANANVNAGNFGGNAAAGNGTNKSSDMSRANSHDPGDTSTGFG